ncbi:MAG: 30S ribosomal protein S12 methylthiotransferase RimO [Clostridiales bacterium]|nr:30S ribosomal protein S12 methylthiotransferase RimO [Eubacteriales bacterium]MDH7565079.1 30S ribosomal protein S12 methylthiotransferase RimO [Clostridiales bacterium]
MKMKIGVVSLGCPKNLVDSEIMLGMLDKDRFEITNNEKDAEIIIVNTCGFIESAKQESIDAILEMAQYKKENCRLLVVTGCLAERYREQILQEIPEVDAVIGTGNYDEIGHVIEKAKAGVKTVLYGKLDHIGYLENSRIVSSEKGCAYLKIAEGCNNGCSYCVIPSLRGPYRSRKMENILKEAAHLAEQGVRELIIVAQDITRYGTDIYKARKLVDLIRELSALEGIQWIRLLYCYPEEIDDRLIEEIATNSKVCKYIDVPIQHASDKILKAMGRRGKIEDVRKLLKRMRDRIPGVIIRTSLIVGFPGEDEEDFKELCGFVREFMFDRLGVFIYSREEGTKAARIRPQVKKSIKEKRYNDVMALQKAITQENNKKRLNRTYETLVEGIAEDGIFYYGRTYAEAPEIDGKVFFTSREPLKAGEFVNVRILDTDDYDLIGEVINESSQ